MSDQRALRVLTSLPRRAPTTNPFVLQLLDDLERRSGDVEVVYFTWRRALLGRWDVFHVHWPERLLRGSSPLRTRVRRAAFRLLLLRLRVGHGAVVRTVHNLASHEAGGAVERRLLDAFDRRTALAIRLNPFTPVPAGAASRTIVHGHYRDWFADVPTEAPVPGRILFFGLLRPYKGVEELLAAFAALDDASVGLRLVGGAQDEALRVAIETAQRRDPRISSVLRYVADPELASEVTEAQLVVLPYRAVHNSGAALLALSLGRPLLMPLTETTAWLRDEVGSSWLHLYEGPLTAEALRAALEATRELPVAPPPLTGRDWRTIGDAHLEAFRSVLER
jgi:beta-1,4-mannosyltransferase